MNSKDLPDDLKVSMTQENDKGEVTFVVLESTGKTMLIDDYNAAVKQWRRLGSVEVRTRASSGAHIRALHAAIKAVRENIEDEMVRSRLEAAMISEVAIAFGILDKSVKDMLRRYSTR